MSLVAHYVTGEHGADYARDGADDVFKTVHVTCNEGRNIEVVACVNL